jgi:hypothetical protein
MSWQPCCLPITLSCAGLRLTNLIRHIRLPLSDGTMFSCKSRLSSRQFRFISHSCAINLCFLEITTGSTLHARDDMIHEPLGVMINRKWTCANSELRNVITRFSMDGFHHGIAFLHNSTTLHMCFYSQSVEIVYSQWLVITKKFVIPVQRYSIVGYSSVLIKVVPLATPLILSPSVTDSDAPCRLLAKLEI